MSAIWRLRSVLLKVPGAYEAAQRLAEMDDGAIRSIPVGPLRGIRWKHDASLPLWYRLGLYEPDVATLIQRHLRPGDTFWDIGANAGYHSLVAARAVGARGQILAVEADPVVAEMARSQTALNPEGARITVIERAVAARVGAVTFAVNPNNRMSAISSVAQHPGSDRTVDATTLDALADEFGAPDLIKMDIEGGETLALPGGERLFATDGARPRVLLSTHSEDGHRFCSDFMSEAGYLVCTSPAFPQMLICIPSDGAETAGSASSL